LVMGGRARKPAESRFPRIAKQDLGQMRGMARSPPLRQALFGFSRGFSGQGPPVIQLAGHDAPHSTDALLTHSRTCEHRWWAAYSRNPTKTNGNLDSRLPEAGMLLFTIA
jgi:hypothetical protein